MPPLSFLPFQTRAAGQAGQESHPAGRHQPPDAIRLEASIRNSFSQHAPASPQEKVDLVTMKSNMMKNRNVQNTQVVENVREAGLALMARSTPNDSTSLKGRGWVGKCAGTQEANLEPRWRREAGYGSGVGLG